ncbi:MAG: cell division protein ZapA [Oscillospiraceae bacterium]|nr:cell division protein ZapA [Oscillospiraceae bacterium]
MSLNSVKVNIVGREYSLRTDDSEEYLLDVASRVDSEMRTIIRDNPGIGAFNAAVLAALNACDVACKANEAVDNLRTQMQGIIADSTKTGNAKERLDARVKELEAKLGEAERENKRLRAENQELKRSQPKFEQISLSPEEEKPEKAAEAPVKAVQAEAVKAAEAPVKAVQAEAVKAAEAPVKTVQEEPAKEPETQAQTAAPKAAEGGQKEEKSLRLVDDREPAAEKDRILVLNDDRNKPDNADKGANVSNTGTEQPGEAAKSTEQRGEAQANVYAPQGYSHSKNRKKHH